ncbi:MAG: STAS domain-containing protein [Bacilli bacterium]|nr:STAS domain-containing protein [Bacilli bacterium]
MNINSRVEGNTLFIDLEGRLDTVTSQQLAELIPLEKRRNLDIDFNFEKLDYVSSAGLRILVLFKKEAQATNNKMVIRNINEVIKEIFTVTGFDKILKIVE